MVKKIRLKATPPSRKGKGRPQTRKHKPPPLDAEGRSKGELIGYARVSTVDQNLALQRDALTEAGCGRIFANQHIRRGRAPDATGFELRSAASFSHHGFAESP